MQKQISVMTAKELLTQLLDLQKERADFDDLDVYITVIDQRTFDEEHADPHLDEMTDTIIADGSAYAMVEVTDYDMTVSPPREIGDYLLIRGVELEDE